MICMHNVILSFAIKMNAYVLIWGQTIQMRKEYTLHNEKTLIKRKDPASGVSQISFESFLPQAKWNTKNGIFIGYSCECWQL